MGKDRDTALTTINSLKYRIEIALLLSLITAELFLAVILALFPYVPDYGLRYSDQTFRLIVRPLAPLLVIGLLFGSLVRLSLRLGKYSIKVRSGVHFLSIPFQKLLVGVRSFSIERATGQRFLAYPLLSLLLAIISGILLSYFPYRPDLNPGALVGVDSSTYKDWLDQMLAKPPGQALVYAFVTGLEGSRPVLLIPLYLVALSGVPTLRIIMSLPMVLAPLVSVSAYVFVRYGQGNARFAGLVSIFTGLSFYTTIGMWGGYLANWLALSETYLFLTILLLYAKSSSILKLGGMFLLTTGLLLTHPWTWVQVFAVSLAFMLATYRETRRFFLPVSVAALGTFGVILDFVKSWAFGTRNLTADLATKTPAGGPAQSLLSFWPRIIDATIYFHQGLMADSIILGASLVGVLLLRFKDPFQRLLILWVAVSAIPFLVLDSYHQARILYNLPIPILTAFGWLFLASHEWRFKRLCLIVLVLGTLLATVYALESMILVNSAFR